MAAILKFGTSAADALRMAERWIYFLAGIGLMVVLGLAGWFVGRLLQLF
jgi:hypothetical protein